MKPFRRLGPQRHVCVVDLALAGAFITNVLCNIAAKGEWLSIVPRPDGHVVGLEADDGLNPSGLACFIELVGAEEVAVIRHCERWHLHARCFFEQILHASRAIQHGVLGVRVQVNEVLIVPHLAHLQAVSAGSA